jgi:hypothetical protein
VISLVVPSLSGVEDGKVNVSKVSALTGRNNQIILDDLFRPLHFVENREKGKPFTKKALMKKRKEVVIAKDKALFRLDGRGRWHSEAGEFLHRKIIEHFHASIRKDEDGFHLMQKHRDFREKVYFPYEDTPLFAFDVLKGEKIELILNTRRKMKLSPKKMFIQDDELYMRAGEDRVKFTDHALIKLSPFLEFEGDQAYIKVRGRRYKIPEH